MLPNFNQLFPQLPDTSRVWLYVSDRPFDATESNYIQDALSDFTQNKWATHGTKLMASGSVLMNQLVVLAVDEEVMNASGCSIDSSVRLMKQIGTELKVDFFNRLFVLISKESEIKRVHFQDLHQYADWKLLNPMVSSLEEVRNRFLIDVKESNLFR
ncbi:MAG: hypothetical protein K9G36_07815 [Crocinitomicaceae bacterium]|nr:hypothetical protein [Crocinitomicaceae bacterium]MCF8443672.1 hypothetical protein [Crocinitomicaceae bacterium]